MMAFITNELLLTTYENPFCENTFALGAPFINSEWRTQHFLLCIFFFQNNLLVVMNAMAVRAQDFEVVRIVIVVIVVFVVDVKDSSDF